MIDRCFLFPQYYIAKVPKCDSCVGKILTQTGVVLASNPIQIEYVCPECKQTYYFKPEDIEGEWKWKVI